MLNFQDYQRMTQQGVTTTGSAHTTESKSVIEATWYDDPASTVAYFYDYYHDDEPNLNTRLHPEKSKTKIPIDIKYIQSNYQTLAKDVVDYKIMFKPSHKCEIPYYKDKFEKVTHSTYPVGLYLDLKNSDGIWERWLVVGNSNVNNMDFPNWSILPCGYKYQWVYKGKKMSMWGVERSQNSYNN